MQTAGLLVQTLCAACVCRCPGCPYAGARDGADYEQAEAFARRFYIWLRENRPELDFEFSLGCAAEHPQLLRALDFMNETGSPMGRILPANSFHFRPRPELRHFLSQLRRHGVQALRCTFYGTRAVHDRAVGRIGDFHSLWDTALLAREAGLQVQIRLALTHESAAQLDALLLLFLGRGFPVQLTLPEGTEASRLAFRSEDYALLSAEAKKRFPAEQYKTEAEWCSFSFEPEEFRTLRLSLTQDNLGWYEQSSFSETLQELEELDEACCSAVPDPAQLQARFGDPTRSRYYSRAGIQRRWLQRWLQAERLTLYDLTDLRQNGSTRY